MLRDPRGVAGFLALLVTLIVFDATARGCGCRVLDVNERQRMDLGHVMSAVRGYYETHGAIPQSDAQSSWYEKLVNGEFTYYDRTHLGLSTDARVPMDRYGSPLVIKQVDSEDGTRIVVRAVGRNGVDDGGALDDWDYGREPNLGYWYKEDWVADSMQGLAIALLSAVLCVVLGVMTRKNVARVVWSLLIIGMFDGLVITTTDLGASPNPAPFIQVQGIVGMVALLFGALAGITFGIGAAATASRSRGAAASGLCRECRYDLRGSDSPRCPECGTWRERAVHDGVTE